jgi:hypothetical protein
MEAVIPAAEVSGAALQARLRAMRPLLLLVSLSVLLACAGSAQAASARTHRGPATCAAKRSTTVALNPQARVYVRSQRGDADQHLLVGCLLRSGRSLQLDSWTSCGCSRGDESAPQLWLRGTVVAMNRYSCPPDPTLGDCVGGASTLDLRTRRTLRRANTGTFVSALVLGPGGAFAYVSSGGVVSKSDAGGEGVLDATPGIDSDSLAIAGARVYWTRAGGSAQSALLTP